MGTTAIIAAIADTFSLQHRNTVPFFSSYVLSSSSSTTNLGLVGFGMSFITHELYGDPHILFPIQQLCAYDPVQLYPLT